MKEYQVIGKSVIRKEAPDKVTGAAKYTNDYKMPETLYGRILTSPNAHAKIVSIDTSKAEALPGVRAILTGNYFPHLIGSEIEERPIIAIDKVRYNGEVVAVVVADSDYEAKKAVTLIKVKYEPLPVINSPSQALNSTILIHEQFRDYKVTGDVYPEFSRNVANRTKIRKGNMERGWAESEVIIEETFAFPQSDHIAMETRCASAQIKPDGDVIIWASSQSPFPIKNLISYYFNINPGKVIVNVPLVGGAYGGKTSVFTELIAFLASTAVGGRYVKVNFNREEDITTAPVHIGLEAKVKLGCKSNGKFTAAEITHMFDGGAYSERGVIVSRAAAVDCTGPYNIENLSCDSLCMYTNHPMVTAFRGFGHSELTFVIERAIDILASKLNMDPLEIRLKNAIMPGDTSPTQVPLNRSNLGDLPKCIKRLSEIIDWSDGDKIELEKGIVRAKGVCCIWKTSNSPTDASGGVTLTFNIDGSININCGAVEIGQGTKTGLTLILAERLKMDVNKVHIAMLVNTKISPEHWKTVASRTTHLVGNALLAAAEDVICQLKITASMVLNYPPENFEVAGERVFLRHNPVVGIDVKDLAFGYKYPNGKTVGKQIIGRGSYTFNNLTYLDKETGKGVPGPEWTVGAQAVEVEFDARNFTYKILRAVSVIDCGKILNRNAAVTQISGGMSMGLSFGSREGFHFSEDGTIKNQSLRSYKVIKLGENPKYIVEFIETPYEDGPYGSRGIGEHGTIGMPAALSNSLSVAAEVQLKHLPLVPELIWRTKTGG